jgi:hypothetical protein
VLKFGSSGKSLGDILDFCDFFVKHVLGFLLFVGKRTLRQARLDAPGTLHHVSVRGIEKQRIVQHRKDRQDFVS